MFIEDARFGCTRGIIRGRPDCPPHGLFHSVVYHNTDFTNLSQVSEERRQTGTSSTQPEPATVFRPYRNLLLMLD